MTDAEFDKRVEEIKEENKQRLLLDQEQLQRDKELYHANGGMSQRQIRRLKNKKPRKKIKKL